MKKFIIYTDGSNNVLNKTGGWGCVIYPSLPTNHEKLEFNGHYPYPSSSNQMELMAIINAVKHVPNNSSITIYTDSRHIVFGVDRGQKIWPKNKWISKNGLPISNRDLWEEYFSIVKKYKEIKVKWVKGHSDNIDNTRADILARLGSFNRIVSPQHQNDVFDVFINIEARTDIKNSYSWEVIMKSTKQDLEHKGLMKNTDFFTFYNWMSKEIVKILSDKNYQFAHIYSSTRSFAKFFNQRNESAHFMHTSDQKIQPHIKKYYKERFY